MYSRTQNENGTYNTRCLYCFMTVGSAVPTEAELAEIESEHNCPEKVLALWNQDVREKHASGKPS